MNKIFLNSILVGILFIVGGIWSYTHYLKQPKEQSSAEKSVEMVQISPSPKQKEESNLVLTDITAETGGSHVNKGSNSQKLPLAPALQKISNAPASVAPEIGAKIVTKINEVVDLLQKDSGLFNEWIDLGLLRKEMKDYEGAKEAWEYASFIRPENSVSFANLGILYGYYLKNNILAEKNFLKVLENDQKIPYLYIQVADFYLEVMQDKVKAHAIIEKGIAQVPNDESLKQALNSY